jgi:hypothetical protein
LRCRAGGADFGSSCRPAETFAPVLVAGRIGIISAADAVVIRRRDRGTDGGSTKANADTNAHAAPAAASIAATAVPADVTDAAANATDVTDAAAGAATKGKRISRNAGDCEDRGHRQ